MAHPSRRRRHCPSKYNVTTGLLLSLLALATPTSALRQASTKESPLLSTTPDFPTVPPRVPLDTYTPVQTGHDFSLRHIFHRGTHKHPKLHLRRDITPETQLWVETEDGALQPDDGHYFAQSAPLEIQRLVDRRLSTIESHLSAARLKGDAVSLASSAWTLDELDGPNIRDKKTVVSMAKMAANAYVEKSGEGDWQDPYGGFNESQPFGWETDGLRGHVFANKDNSTIIIGLKGTSTAVFDGEETTTNDKVNDNLFFSCCCGQGGQYLWKQVCDCYTNTFTCNQTCLVKALKQENRYYRAAIELYTNVTEIYPDSNVWLSGHSLGGSVASLLGQTFGLATTTFEAPGEALAAKRLGLPAPPGSDPNAPQTKKNTGIFHFGHTADPVYMGTCNGVAATCTFAGYAMETQCHAGQICEYDTVNDFGWRVGIGNHRILVVIDSVLEKYDKVPECVQDSECIDCYNWKYFHDNGTNPSISKSSSTTSTRTRTTTCKTPGWWGCLDETTATTTTSTSSSSVSSTVTTSTCKTPGWFGCKDPTTKTITTSTSTAATASATPAPAPSVSTTPSFPTGPTKSSSPHSTSCHHPGFFGGCNDPTPTATAAPRPTSKSMHKHHCETPGLFFGCKDRSHHHHHHSITSAPTSPLPTSAAEPECTQKRFFGLICVDPSPSTYPVPSGTTTTAEAPAPTKIPGKEEKCLRRYWFGGCRKWGVPGDGDGDDGDWKDEV